MTEEKMEKAMLCEEELDNVVGGCDLRPLPPEAYKKVHFFAKEGEEAETLMGDFAQSKMEYEVHK